MFNNQNYKRFFSIKANDERNLANINVIKANKQMSEQIKGKPRKVTELRDGSLLVEVSNEQQSKLIQSIVKLDDTKVTVSEHPSLNTVKGTIRYKNNPNYNEIEILQELKQHKVIDIYRVKRKANGSLENTNIYILTFDLCTLPRDVFIGWTRCEVREYIPRPRRCFKCQEFRHGSRACRADVSICVRCGEEYHTQQCERPPKCKNCGENHPASSTDCFYYKLEQEAIKIKTREKVSFAEARKKATEKMINPTTSYAAITANTHQIEKSIKRQNNSISTHLRSPNQKSPRGSAQDNAQPKQDHEKLRTAPIVQTPNPIVTSIDISHRREKQTKQMSQQEQPTQTLDQPAIKQIPSKETLAAILTSAQTNNAKVTVTCNKDESKEQQSTVPCEKKRDGSSLGDTENGGRAKKKSMISVPSQLSGLISPSQLPSPSPVLPIRGTSRQKSTMSRDHKREKLKEKSNDDDKMNYEDY